MSYQNHGWAAKAGLDAAALADLYLTLTDGEIARRYGVSDVAVALQRHRWGIATLTTRQRRDLARPHLQRLDDLTPTLLADLYAQMGDRQIAALYGVAKPTIRNLRLAWGIASRSKSSRATSAAAFTEEQKEVCLGTLLGDAFLHKRGVLKVSHSSSQLTYLRRLHALLAPHVRPIFYEEKTQRSGNVAFAFGFRTIQHEWLRSIYELFYPDGKKVFPESVVCNLPVRSLAVWYFDDGNLDSGLPSIALGDCSAAEAEDVARWLNARFGFDAYVLPQSTASCRLVGLRSRSTDVFFRLVRDFATSDMLHKLPKAYWPAGVLPQPAVRTAESARLPRELQKRSKQWLALSSDDQGQLLEAVAAFWQAQGFPHAVPKPEEVLALQALDECHVIQDGVIKRRQVGQSTCHAFSRGIWEARNRSKALSPLEVFADKQHLKEAIRLRLAAGQVPEAAQIRSAVRYYMLSGVYNFRPSAAKVLVDRYCRAGGVVWDPCAGYGGRLLGSLLSRAQPCYLACEPQPETIARLRQLVAWLETYVPGVSARVALHERPAEEFVPSDVDMVLTSPPYWRTEVYGEAETQAGIRYSTYEAWLAGFWKVVLERAVQALRPGGWLALNVDDFVIDRKRYPLIADTQRLVREAGLLGEAVVYRYAMPTSFNKDNAEVVLCWVKAQESKPVRAAAPAQETALAVVDSVPAPLPTFVCSSCGAQQLGLPFAGGVCLPCRTATRACKGCGREFLARRADHEFHDEACHARYRRAEQRLVVPAKTVRTFTCQACSQTFTGPLTGGVPARCPPCVKRDEIAARTKTCAYRHCGASFVDSSLKNSMSYCSEEHCRREKQIRRGKAVDESSFRANQKTGCRKCMSCGDLYWLAEGEKVVRCPACREKSRHKACRRCGASYYDASVNNTRRYCDACA